jgi:hypothetical protein
MNQLVPKEVIEKRILLVRGQKVMLDKDLSLEYQDGVGHENFLMLLQSKVLRCFPVF